MSEANVQARRKIDWASIVIEDVWEQLGGPEIRWKGTTGRCRAWWRNGRNPNSVSLNRESQVWHDFVTDAGGGILRLVEVVLQIDKAEAARWIASRYGFEFEEFDRADWLVNRKLRSYADLWRRGYLRQLETANVQLLALVDSQSGNTDERLQNWLKYTWICQELYRVEKLCDVALAQVFEDALKLDASSTAKRIQEQLDDDRHAVEVAAAITAIIEIASERQGSLPNV